LNENETKELVLETPPETPKTEPKALPPIIKSGKFIEPPLVNALLVYMDSRPHGEVRNLIDSLSRLPDITATFKQ
jgi:hypothetical protein